MLMKKGVDLSNQKIGNPNVKPVFLDMKNPLVYDFKGSGYRDVSFSDLIDKAIQNGNDGVVFKNSWDPVLGDQYVVFSPTQIKSATGNSGAFSPTNPDIRGSSALPMLGLTGATGLGALTGLELARRKQSQKQRSK
jgi:hypothetical protein